jgi:peptide/nickel transport system substrate-binding protein
VTFQDGTPFNASAVVATFDRCLDPELATIKAYLLTPFPKWEALDDYTFVIGGDVAYSALISQIALPELGIMSPTQLEKTYGAEYSDNPVGTGPFNFVENIKGEKVVWEKNPDYWASELYPVNVDNVEWVILIDDETRLAALEAGDVDVIQGVPPVAVERLENQGFKVVSVPGARNHMFAMNVRKPPLNDVRVRQAFNYAINKQEIVDEVFLGTARVCNAPVAPGVWGYVANDMYAYDFEKAESLLDEAGLPRQADGWRFEIDFIVPTGRYMMGKEQAEAVAGYLEKVGVKVNIELVEFGTWAERGAAWTSAVWAGEVEYGDFDLSYSSWSTMTLDVDYGLYGNHVTDGYWNRATYSNPEVDRLMLEGRAEFDMEERFDIFAETQRVIMDDAPHIYVVTEPIIVAMRADLEGIQALPNDYYFVNAAYFTE